MKVARKRPAIRRTKPLITLFEWLRRWSLRFAAVSGLSLLIVVGFRTVLFSPLLSLQRIEVKTQGRLERRGILQWAKLRPGGSILTLNLGRIRRTIEAHPWVERAWVERAFPHTLKIRIRERRPVAKVILDQATFLLDASGTLFAPWDEALRGDWIPLVGLRHEDLLQRPEACQRVLQEALHLMEIVQYQLDMEIEEVRLNPDRGLRLALKRGPSDIRLGFGDLNERIDRLGRILRHLAKEGQIRKAQWIDLRYPRRATVKFKG